MWRVELPKEQLAGLERAEYALATGLPEVHLVELALCAEQLEPVAIGDADEGAHWASGQ
jgi:serine/threonine protein kinase HipA of HipAB toxin-antitoxin module